MPVIRRQDVKSVTGGDYPAPFDGVIGRYEAWPPGDAGGLTQFGVNLETLFPGSMSSHRHWHENEDEFVYLLEGEAVLIDDDGEHPIGPGDAAVFKAGDANGHHFQNRSDKSATFLVVGTRAEDDRCHYSDIDLLMTKIKTGYTFTHRDGSPLKAGDEA